MFFHIIVDFMRFCRKKKLEQRLDLIIFVNNGEATKLETKIYKNYQLNEKNLKRI